MNRLAYPALAGLLLLALALRIIGAHGELGLDEVWSLQLLQPITRPDQIFWKINHDNNHFLNSLWLYLVGPAAPPVVQRLLAIVLGVASVAAAGLWTRRHGVVPALITVALFAAGYGMVHYGSEARGYSGLVLFTVLALYWCEKILNGEKKHWQLAGACLLGLLCHLNMIFLLAMIGVWVTYVEIRRQPDFIKVGDRVIQLFWPTLLCVFPVIALIVYRLHNHAFALGMYDPFDPRDFTQSYGLMIRSLTQLPGLGEATTHLALPCIALYLAYNCRLQLKDRFSLYLIGIVVFPVALYMFKLPNTDQPRYFLISATIYLLMIGDLIGVAWNQGKRNRIIAGVIAATVIAGNVGLLQHFFADGRGHYREAVAAMTASGPARYGTDDAFRNNMLVGYYAKQLGVAATYIPETEWCAAPPNWYLSYAFTHDAPQESLTIGPDACKQVFTAPQVFDYWGLSGFQWSLYRRTP